MAKDQEIPSWISLILRAAIASLFIAAAVPKWMSGVSATSVYFQDVFKETWLPMALVELHGRLVPFIEAAIPIWLLSGIRLNLAWLVTALFLVSLGFGMVVAGQYDTAANNYLYVLISVVGLYFSPYDKYNIKDLQKRRR